MTGHSRALPLDPAWDQAPPGFVVHLTVDAPNEAAALTMAEQVATSVAAWLPQLAVSATEVSREDDQRRRLQVFCGRRMWGGKRCLGRLGHEEPHGVEKG